MSKVAIVQSNYIPWKGYFDLINAADIFVLYDDMQYTRRDWRNRNLIKTPQGTRWLTIPVTVKGKYYQKIRETQISDISWAEKHWRILEQNYRKAPYFRQYCDLFRDLYRRCGSELFLSRINHAFIRAINEILQIETELRWSSEFTLQEGRTQRLLSICRDCGSDTYLSGPSAREYFDEELARAWNVTVQWSDYSGYPEYQQLYPPFDHQVSILDLIFNVGPTARDYMKSFA